MPCLRDLYPGVCLTTQEKARGNLSQDSGRVPAGTMKTECTEQHIHNNKNEGSVRFNMKQDRQFKHNVTLRRVRATIVGVGKQLVLCILSVCP